jgi:hypothetical protein
MDDVFSLTFSTIKGRLKNSKSNSQNSLVDVDQSHLNSHVSKNYDLSERRSQMYYQYSLVLRQRSVIEKMLNDIKIIGLSQCAQQFSYSLKQLQNQSSISERRLRELVFEVIGEYGKSIIRAKRRHLYLRLSNRIDRVWSIHIMRWKIFMCRLIYEAFCHVDRALSMSQVKNSVSSIIIVCPRANSLEYSALAEIVQKFSVSQSTECVIVTAVKYPLVDSTAVNSGSRKSTLIDLDGNQGGNYDKIRPVVASNLSELKHVVREVQELIHPSLPPPAPRPRSGLARNNSLSNIPKVPIPLPSMSRPHSGSRLKSPHNTTYHPCSLPILSSQPINWMKPTMASPISSDILNRLQGSRPGGPERGQRSNQFDAFAARYVSQYSCSQHTDYLYFCIEERLCSGINVDDFGNDKLFNLLKHIQVEFLP